MITFDGKGGNFDKTMRWLAKRQNGSHLDNLEKYAEMGLRALEKATPVDSRITAGAWYYKIKKNTRKPTISWHNRNVVDGVPVVILIQYGHGTRGGTYVQGRDFINPAIQPVFDRIAADVWKKVKS